MVVALLMCACGNSVVSVTVSVVPYIMFICVLLKSVSVVCVLLAVSAFVIVARVLSTHIVMFWLFIVVPLVNCMVPLILTVWFGLTVVVFSSRVSGMVVGVKFPVVFCCVWWSVLVAVML